MEQRFTFLHSLQDISMGRGKSRSFLIFLGLSFFFWIITKFSNQYTEALNFEIGIDDLPAEVIPLSKDTSEVQVTLSASGFQLIFFKIFIGKLMVNADKGNFENGIATIPLDFSINEIQNQLFGETEIRSFFPNTISFDYSRLDTKRIPVKLPLELDVVAGFGVSETPLITPDSISVIGSSKILDTLKAVYLNPILFSKVTESFENEFELFNPDSSQLEFSESLVNLKVVIDRFSEKTLNVPIRITNVPDSIALKLFPSSIKITFSASLTDIKSINPSDFVFTCDYNSIKKGVEGLPIYFKEQPEHIQNIRWSPKQVEYLIRK